MRRSRWIEQSQWLALLALAFTLAPAWLAVVTYRDGRQKDELVYQTTTQVLGEQLQRSFERHTYLPREVRQQARNLDEAALVAGKMLPVFPWQERLPHLIAMGYAKLEGDRLVMRWLSDQRVSMASLGDDLMRLPGVKATLRTAPVKDLFATIGCQLDHQRMLILLTLPDQMSSRVPRGYIVAWIDLESLCRDHALDLIRDQVLVAEPSSEMRASSPMARFMPVSDGEAKWFAGIERGAGFDKYGAPTPWLTFIAVGLSTLPLLVLTWLASRSARLSASLVAEREILKQQRFFTQSVSHEFRTPLGIIMSGADLLDEYLDHLTPERRREVLAEIKDNTRLMSGMVEQVLILGRIESSQQACNPKLVNVATLCCDIAHKVCASMNRPQAIQITAPDREAMLDATVLGSLLSNLLSNAIKYSPSDKRVTLEVTLSASEIIFVVRDEGIGIPEDEITRVCDPFHRGANVGDAPGAGLGLAITQRCVALHGGKLHIESSEGRGTTMTVILPVP